MTELPTPADFCYLLRKLPPDQRVKYGLRRLGFCPDCGSFYELGGALCACMKAQDKDPK